MTRLIGCMVVLASAALAGTAWAEAVKTEPQVRLELELVDGSRLIGTPHIEAVPVETSYAKMKVPWKQIMAIAIGADRETAALELRNGNQLKGVLQLESIRMETIFGRVAVKLEHLSALRVVPANRALPDALQQGLVLYYSFDRDEGGTVTDESGKKNNGAVKGAKWMSKGKVGGAYDFDGQESYIEALDDATLNPKCQLTQSAWVQIRDNQTFLPAIVSKGNIGSYKESYGMFVGADRLASCLVNRDGEMSGRGLLFGSEIPPNEWTHIAVTFDGHTLLLYINGKAGARVAHSGGLFASSSPLLIGKTDRQGTSYPTACFNGLIDEVMIFDRALTEAEVKQLYDARK